MRYSAASHRRLLVLAREKAGTLGPATLARLITPDTPAFRCQADRCDALCCRAPYRAEVTPRDREALIPLAAGLPAALDERPLLMLRQTQTGACVFLGQDRRCGVYAARPDGCVQYPFLLVFVPRDGDQIVAESVDPAALDAAVAAAAGDADQARPAYVPLLLRDPACPGFTEAPLGAAGYAALLGEIRALDRCHGGDDPCGRHAASCC